MRWWLEVGNYEIPAKLRDYKLMLKNCFVQLKNLLILDSKLSVSVSYLPVVGAGAGVGAGVVGGGGGGVVGGGGGGVVRGGAGVVDGQSSTTFFSVRVIVLLESYWEPSDRRIVSPQL